MKQSILLIRTYNKGVEQLLDTLNEKMVFIKGKRRKKHKWEVQLEDYQDELIGIEQEITNLTVKLKSEEKDVKKLEGIGITNLIQTLIGKKYEKIEIEKQEVVAVQLQLEEARKTKLEIEESIVTLIDRLESVSGVEEEYQALITLKTEKLQGNNAAFREKLYELSEKEGDTGAYVEELEEALEAGNTVIDALNQAIASLDEAESWGTFDLFGGGALSSAVKHDYIDKATEHIHVAQGRMRHFQKELLDIDQTAQLQIDISGLLKFADFFFDGFIVDWMVQERISESLENIKSQKSTVTAILRELEEEKEEKENEHTLIIEERTRLIEDY
ncbi:hypothetical protein [Oceanobacillus bengalensis]|uniref:hypothetical protein n=1 Tax=Oceanobacillus bengalensis TaxID=1435466 RepID=UPI0011C4409C|nr:hypothetical protein [Oceanobacillus bengalensis]